MKIKKMYLKSNTRQENFRTFEERDILNGIKSDQLPAEKTSLHVMVLPVKSLCVLSWLAAVLSSPRNDFLCEASWTSGTRHMVDLVIGKNPFSGQCSSYWLITVNLATLRFNGATAVSYILVVSWSHSKLQKMVQFSLVYSNSTF